MNAERRLAVITNPDHEHGTALKSGLESLGYHVLPPPKRPEQLTRHLEKQGERLSLLLTLPGDERSMEEPENLGDEAQAKVHAETLTGVMNANAHAPIALTEQLLPHMASGARIIHVAPTRGSGPGARMSRRTLVARSRVLEQTTPEVHISTVESEPVVDNTLALLEPL